MTLVVINYGFKLLQVSSSLNSSYCFILQTEASIFTWVGNLSSSRDHDLLDRMLDLINVCDSVLAKLTCLFFFHPAESSYHAYFFHCLFLYLDFSFIPFIAKIATYISEGR